MSTFVDRLKLEHDELKDKFLKLEEFLNTEKLKELEYHQQGLLIKQHKVMEKYLEILHERIITNS